MRTRSTASVLWRSLVALAAISLSASVVPAADDLTGRWDLSHIYPSDQAFEQAREELAGKIGSLDRFKGRLDESAATLKEAMDAMFGLRKDATRLSSYASMRADEDTRESGPQGMRQSVQTLVSELLASVAWVDPELLAVPQERIDAFLAEEPGLAQYARYFEELRKRRPHVLDAEGEKLLGMSQRIRGSGETVGSLLRNAEIPWPTITLSDGTQVRIDAQGYTRVRYSQNREDRVKAYEAFYKTLDAFKSSLAATLSATVQEHVFESRARSYDSSLEASLAANEVDPAVYGMLVEQINASLPTLYRYLEIRRRILGLDDLRYHDMYPPLVDDVNADYSYANSKKLVSEALEPLGSEYVERFNKALDSGWVDVYPRPGKRQGAYVNDAAFDVHPYMLLNHQDDYLSASTLAHEGGHLMHSWYSQEAQPYPTADYSIFVAEVASTVNEVMFFKHLVAQAKSDDARLALLGNFLEGLRTTVFRQTMFAEFELKMHELGERGEPITGDSLDALYAELLRRYHGQDQGVTTIDDLYTVEWAFIPHFHYNFYVYQYATSYVAATALAEAIMENRPGARERFLAFLRSGSTKPPVELLQDAGVDMTKPGPIQAAMRLMNDVMDQIEEILARRD